jgi:hypothetical protein
LAIPMLNCGKILATPNVRIFSIAWIGMGQNIGTLQYQNSCGSNPQSPSVPPNLAGMYRCSSPEIMGKLQVGIPSYFHVSWLNHVKSP